MRGRKAEVTLQGMVISTLTAFLFIGVIGFMVTMTGENYDISGYEENDLSKYQRMENISTAVQNAYEDVDQVTIDKGVFDFFSDIYNKIIAPFKFIYRSFTTIIGLTTHVVNDFKLLSIFKVYIEAIFTVLIIIGIVLIKFYMGRKK